MMTYSFFAEAIAFIISIIRLNIPGIFPPQAPKVSPTNIYDTSNDSVSISTVYMKNYVKNEHRVIRIIKDKTGALLYGIIRLKR